MYVLKAMVNARARLHLHLQKSRIPQIVFAAAALAAVLHAPISPAFADETTPADPQNPAPALEGKEREEALATELFNAARDLMGQERFGDACPKLIESAKLSPKVGTLGKLAECEEKLGQLVSARARWMQARHLAEAQHDERLSIVNTELARIDAKVPKLALALPKPLPAGLLIRVDGIEISAAAADMPIPLDPGRHGILVSAPNKKPWNTDISLKADGSMTLAVVPALENVEEAPQQTKTVALPAPSSPYRYLGFGAAGLGGVGIAMGAFFGGRAMSKLDESNRLGCIADHCSSAAAEVRREARNAGNISTAFFIVGSALFAGGLTLVAFAPEAAPKSTGRKAAQTKILAQASGISIQGEWQ